MNQKQIGIAILILSILIFGVVTSVKISEDNHLEKIIQEKGSCYLDDGTCLHEERNLIGYILGWIISGAMLLFSLYLIFIDKTQEKLSEHQVQISRALEGAKKKDEFTAFLAGFSEDEQKILKVIKEQEGIKQSTIRYKTNISKTRVSLILKELEEKGLISRKESGKTKQVYLIKKF